MKPLFLITILITALFVSISSTAEENSIAIPTGEQEESAAEFKFLLQRVVHLEQEIKILNAEYVSIGNAVYTNNRLTSDYNFMKEEVAFIRHKIIKIKDTIESGDFTPQEVFKLKERIKKLGIEQIEKKIDEKNLKAIQLAKAEWRKDDADVEQRVYTKATDRAFDEAIAVLGFVVIVFGAAFAWIEFSFREKQIKEGVSKQFIKEGENYRIALFKAKVEQEDNAREDTYKASLIYCNVALSVYTSRFLCDGDVAKYTNPQVSDVENQFTSLDKDHSSLDSQMKYSPQTLVEVIELQKNAYKILQQYIDESINKPSLKEHFLDNKPMQEKYLKERNRKNSKVYALFGEVCNDIAYYYCDFRHKRVINQSGLSEIQDHYDIFLKYFYKWIESEKYRDKAGLSPHGFGFRLASILDCCVVIEVILGSFEPIEVNDFETYLNNKLVKIENKYNDIGSYDTSSHIRNICKAQKIRNENLIMHTTVT